jgi:hypothetical protein
MHTHTYTHVYKCILGIYIYIHKCIYIHKYMSAHIHTYTYVHTHIQNVHMHARKHAWNDGTAVTARGADLEMKNRMCYVTENIICN